MLAINVGSISILSDRRLHLGVGVDLIDGLGRMEGMMGSFVLFGCCFVVDVDSYG